MRSGYLALAGVILLLIEPACRKAGPIGKTSDTLPHPAPDTVLRIHWMGKRQMAIDGSAFYFNRLWDLPASRTLEVRALNQLAVTPWRLLQGDASVANAPAAPLRELLESLKYSESYLEVRSSTGQPMEAALAVRVSDEHANLWGSNAAIVVSSLARVSPVSNAGNKKWSTVIPGTKTTIEFVRAKGWLILALREDRRNLISEIEDHIRRQVYPFSRLTRGPWLQVDANLPWLATMCGRATTPSKGLPVMSLTVTGDSSDVLSHLTLTFPKPLPNALHPWAIPIDLIREPLTSLVLARGTRDLLGSIAWWDEVHLGDAPDQLFAWSTGQNPFQFYVAAPMPDARTRMNALTTHLLGNANEWLTNNGPNVEGSGIPLFEKLPDANGVRWTLEGVWPFVKSAEDAGKNFVVAGLTPDPTSAQTTTLLANRLKDALVQTNLVYQEWESTASRLEAWLPVLQMARVLAHRAPLPEKCPGLEWLMALETRMRDTDTRITRTGPDKLEVSRRSTTGLNALELHLLVDWLESPEFPKGLHTTVTKPQENK